ncbi:MAG: carbohydrate kinase [Hyphomicrobiales bacterium]|nr:FGGY-family carbohydrate kinase [Hyphomicrobiales bacterium]PCJ81848.1 MAG: carbohydrate kinase [Hyphomicrobiales bacterium]
MPNDAAYLGIDLGTSGARAIVMRHDGKVIAEGQSAMADHGANHRDPKIWWAAVETALHRALADIDGSNIIALCVDGTSGTMIPIDGDGTPLAEGRMYNDPCEDTAILAKISEHAPQTSAAHGPTSGLAKALIFQEHFSPTKIIHQADWIAGLLCGTFSSDDNNALKTGYDPIAGQWPDWIAKTGLDLTLLPQVREPGATVATILPAMAKQFGLPKSVKILAGTTDGCASFLATGADKPGDGVTALGTTLTIKFLSNKPLFDPSCGVYSHHIMGMWLAGGASNTGGNVLLAHFSPEDMVELSAEIDPESDSGLNYYPLVQPGERFPIADPNLAPRLSPRPENSVDFLKGLFEGIADIEALAYQKLMELGGPKLTSVRSVGGGAQNPVWTRIRERHVGVVMVEPANTQAAYGAACLARFGMST